MLICGCANASLLTRTRSTAAVVSRRLILSRARCWPASSPPPPGTASNNLISGGAPLDLARTHNHRKYQSKYRKFKIESLTATLKVGQNHSISKSVFPQDK